MITKTEKFLKPFLKKGVSNIRAGDTVRVHQKTKIGKQERIQVFEGLVLAKKHGKGISATITVRKVISVIGVEKIFPIHSPTIEKIEIIKRGKVRKAKLYYLRKAKGKRAKLKTKEFTKTVVVEKPKEEKVEPVKEEKSEEAKEEKTEKSKEVKENKDK